MSNYETRGTAGLGDESFDASHPLTGQRIRVIGVNDDDPEDIKWLIAFIDKHGNRRVESVDSVAPAKDAFGRAKYF